MDQKDLLTQLQELAENLGIRVRFEQIKRETAFFPGGICNLKGENILIINSSARMEDKIEIISSAVKDFDLSGVFIRPALREFLSIDSPEKDDA